METILLQLVVGYPLKFATLTGLNSLILIFKKLKIEERIARSFYFSLLFFLYYKEDFIVMRKKKIKGIHTGIIHIYCGFVALKRAVWV